MEAIKAGFDYLKESINRWHSNHGVGKSRWQKRLFMIGNDAIALGALAGGCRFMAAYPITPASEIMEYLIKKLPALAELLFKQKMKLQHAQWQLVQTMVVFVR